MALSGGWRRQDAAGSQVHAPLPAHCNLLRLQRLQRRALLLLVAMIAVRQRTGRCPPALPIHPPTQPKLLTCGIPIMCIAGCAAE